MDQVEEEQASDPAQEHGKMTPTSDVVDFECSLCAYKRQIPRHKFSEGKTRFRVKCPKCKGESIIDLGERQVPSSPPSCPVADLPELQRMINDQAVSGTLFLPPGEFLGQVVIDRPLVLEGKGKATWIGSSVAPAIRITSPGVVVRDVIVEVANDWSAVAIDSAPGANPLLQRLFLRGTTAGVPQENIHEAQTPQIVFTPPPSLVSPLTADSIEVSSDTVSAAVSPTNRVTDKTLSSRFEAALEAGRREDWLTAVEICLEILALDPEYPEVDEFLRRACKESDTSVSTGATGKSSLETQPASIFPHESASRVDLKIRTLFQRADEAEDRGDWRKAVELYEDILLLSPGQPDAAKLLERARLKSGVDGSASAMQSGPGGLNPAFHVKPSDWPPQSQSPLKTSPLLTQLPNLPTLSTGSLTEAAKNGLLTEVEGHLKRGASINPRLAPNEKNAVMLAAQNGHEQVVRLLLDRGADANEKTSAGVTALMLAAKRSRTGCWPAAGSWGGRKRKD